MINYAKHIPYLRSYAILAPPIKQNIMLRTWIHTFTSTRANHFLCNI